jgi:hypothetical protein
MPMIEMGTTVVTAYLLFCLFVVWLLILWPLGD